VTTHFELKGDQLNANLGLALNGLVFGTDTSAMNDEVKSILASLWAGIVTITVDARLSGTMDSLQLSVSSNVDKMLSDRLQNLYGEKVAELQNRARAEIDRLTAQKQKELMDEYTSRKDAVLKDFTAKEMEVREAVSAIQAQISKKEGAIREQGEQEKGKAEEELRKRATEKAKELFKF
jgi:hypothetical protein